MKLPALPIIRQSKEQIGAYGKCSTDKIWIATELNKAEAAVVQKHEEAHVYLWHLARMKGIEDCNPHLWNIAADCEIAKHIYNTQDEAVICKPRSRLKGGIVKDTFPEMPSDLLYAEEMYNWLVQRQESLPDVGDCVQDEEGEGDTPPPSKEEIAARLEDLKNDIQEREASARQEKEVAALIEQIKSRPPSLIAEINAGLRVRVDRPRTYARQGRRELQGGLFDKGRKVEPRPPLVEIYIDRSGSFCAEKTRVANETVLKVLARYKASIKVDTYYFGNDQLRVSDNKQGGNTPYNLIIDNLCKTMPKIAVIITDDDGCDDYTNRISEQTTVLCVPVGCQKTIFAEKVGGKDVVTNY